MREFRLLESAIKEFSLDLEGLNVLTEAASGNYVWTPIIASMAGANVFAFSRDSRYSSFAEVKQRTLNLARSLGVEQRLTIIDELDARILNSVQIITNTGFLRPLDISKLKHCRKGTVIPLMYEAWEFRESDLDLNYCQENDIAVFGTNESDNRLDTIKYLGVVVKKALLNCNIEVFKSKILILGSGKFACAIYEALKSESIRIEMSEDLSNFKDITDTDAIIVADHQTNNQYIGAGSVFSPDRIRKENPDLTIVHVAGNIDVDSVRNNDIKLFPDHISNLGFMSLTTDYAGPKPLIDLHTAGLKIGELFTREYKKNQDFRSAYDYCLNFQLIQRL